MADWDKGELSEEESLLPALGVLTKNLSVVRRASREVPPRRCSRLLSEINLGDMIFGISEERKFGGRYRARTYDIQLVRLALYQLS